MHGRKKRVYQPPMKVEVLTQDPIVRYDAYHTPGNPGRKHIIGTLAPSAGNAIFPKKS